MTSHNGDQCDPGGAEAMTDDETRPEYQGRRRNEESPRPDESPVHKRQGDIEERPPAHQWDIGQEEPEPRPPKDHDG